VILLGYTDGQVEVLCFFTKQTLFKTQPTQDGIVAGIYFTMKGSNAFLASYHVREDVKEKQGHDGPEHSTLNQHILAVDGDLFTVKHSKSQYLFAGISLWLRRESRMWYATTLLNDDKLLAYNMKVDKTKFVSVVNIEKTLTEGAFQPEMKLDTGIEATKIFYYAASNAIIVVGGCGDEENRYCDDMMVQRWESSWCGQPVMQNVWQREIGVKDSCMLDEHHLVILCWSEGVKNIDLRTMSEAETPMPNRKNLI
jgi:hypothetical protein